MKFYSEKLDRLFDSQKSCDEAEEAHEKALAEAEAKKKALTEKRTERAKEVENLYKEASEATKKYETALRQFIKDYGSYHTTFKTSDPWLRLLDWF